jgi:hypothetical protein
MKQIIHNNKYDTSNLNRIQSNRKRQEQVNRKTKCAKFTYVGRETRCTTRLFKNTDVNVAYTTNNNLGKLLGMRTQITNKYDGNGVYQLECPTCNKKYIGQNGLPFRVRFREHYNDYEYANNKSKFAQHVIDEGHTFGPLNDIMKIVHFAEKGRILDTLERFYIYRETKYGNQINDKLTIESNPIFESLVQHKPYRRPQLHTYETQVQTQNCNQPSIHRIGNIVTLKKRSSYSSKL